VLFYSHFWKRIEVLKGEFDVLSDPCWSNEGLVIRGTIKEKWMPFHFSSSGNMFRRRIT